MNLSSDIEVMAMVESIDDPDARDLLPIYLQSLKDRCTQLEASYNNREWVEVSQIAHSLRGSSAMYGFPPIAALVKSIEELALHCVLDGSLEKEGNLLIKSKLISLQNFCASLERLVRPLH